MHYFSCSAGTGTDLKKVRTSNTKHEFSHPLGYAGDVVHSGESGP
jgi:hypothetical protein